jgi:hypothetical protein
MDNLRRPPAAGTAAGGKVCHGRRAGARVRTTRPPHAPAAATSSASPVDTRLRLQERRRRPRRRQRPGGGAAPACGGRWRRRRAQAVKKRRQQLQRGYDGARGARRRRTGERCKNRFFRERYFFSPTHLPAAATAATEAAGTNKLPARAALRDGGATGRPSGWPRLAALCFAGPPRPASAACGRAESDAMSGFGEAMRGAPPVAAVRRGRGWLWRRRGGGDSGGLGDSWRSRGSDALLSTPLLRKRSVLMQLVAGTKVLAPLLLLQLLLLRSLLEAASPRRHVLPRPSRHLKGNIWERGKSRSLFIVPPPPVCVFCVCECCGRRARAGARRWPVPAAARCSKNQREERKRIALSPLALTRSKPRWASSLPQSCPPAAYSRRRPPRARRPPPPFRGGMGRGAWRPAPAQI